MKSTYIFSSDVNLLHILVWTGDDRVPVMYLNGSNWIALGMTFETLQDIYSDKNMRQIDFI